MFWVLCSVRWNRGKVHHRANVMVIVLPSLKWWSRQPQLKCEHNSCRQLFADLGSMPLYKACQQQFKRSNTWWKLQLNTTNDSMYIVEYHRLLQQARSLSPVAFCQAEAVWHNILLCQGYEFKYTFSDISVTVQEISSSFLRTKTFRTELPWFAGRRYGTDCGKENLLLRHLFSK